MVVIKKWVATTQKESFFQSKLLLEMDENVGWLIKECIGENDF